MIGVQQVIATQIGVMLPFVSEHSHPEAQLLLQKQNGPVLSKISGEWAIGLKPPAGIPSSSPVGKPLTQNLAHCVLNRKGDAARWSETRLQDQIPALPKELLP